MIVINIEVFIYELFKKYYSFNFESIIKTYVNNTQIICFINKVGFGGEGWAINLPRNIHFIGEGFLKSSYDENKCLFSSSVIFDYLST